MLISTQMLKGRAKLDPGSQASASVSLLQLEIEKGGGAAGGPQTAPKPSSHLPDVTDRRRGEQ